MSLKNKAYCAALCSVALLLAWCAEAATYDASTGYVTVEKLGNDGDSVFHYTDLKPIKYNKAEGKDFYYWSDHQYPHSGTNYYFTGGRGWFAGVVTNAAGEKVQAMEFPGDKVVLDGTLNLKCQDAAYSYSFKNLTMLTDSVLRNNNLSGVMDIRGLVNLASSATVNVKPTFSSSSDLTNNIIRLGATLSGEANTKVKLESELSKNVSGIAHGALELLGSNVDFLGTVTVSSNRLVLCSATAVTNATVQLSHHGYLVPQAAAGTVCAVSKLAVNAETATLSLNTTNTLFVTTSISGTVKPYRIELRGDDVSALVARPAFTNVVLKLSSAAASGFAESNFDLPAVGAYDWTWRDATDGGKELVLSCEEIVNMLNEGTPTNKGNLSPLASVTNMNGKNYFWSDHGVPVAGKTYLSQKLTAYVSTNAQGKGIAFAGDRLILDGSSAWTGLNANNGAKWLEVSDLDCRGKIRLQGWCNGLTGFTLRGGVVRMAAGTRFWSYAYNSSNWRIESRIVGEGLIHAGCRGASPTSPRGGLVLVADNSQFYGKVEVAYDPTIDGAGSTLDVPSETYYPYLIVTCAEALGGTLTTFAPDALKIKNYGMFWVTNSVNFATENRGVTVSGFGRVNVANAADTLDFANTVTYDGILRKEGAGTLALGARPKFIDGVSQDLPVAGTNLLVVHAGAIKPLSTEAFTSLAVTFSNDTTIAVNVETTDADLLAKGLVSTGELSSVTWPTEASSSVNVRLDGTLSSAARTRVGVITFSKENDAKTALGKLRFTDRIRGVNVALRVADEANADGTWSVIADCRRCGFAILFR